MNTKPNYEGNFSKNIHDIADYELGADIIVIYWYIISELLVVQFNISYQ